MDKSLMAALEIKEDTRGFYRTTVRLLCPLGSSIASKEYSKEEIDAMLIGIEKRDPLAVRLAIVNHHIALGLGPIFRPPVAYSQEYDGNMIPEINIFYLMVPMNS